MAARYYLTADALMHVRKIVRESARQWGAAQAKSYQASLSDGFQRIADRHGQLPRKSAGVGDLRLHRIHRHYAVFLVLAENRIMIVAVLHERMDVSARLRAMQGKLGRDIGDIRRKVLKDNLSGND